MRTALGASRSRLVRQCMTESAVLGICGGLLGMLAATQSVRPFVALWPGSLPRTEEIHIDWRVLCFAAGVSLFCSFLFGLTPALRVPVHGLEEALRAGGRSITGNSRRLHSPFVISEIALAMVLLVSAGLVRGRTLTSYHTIQDDIRNAGGHWVDREVVEDGNWVTSRQPDDLPAFNEAMLRLFAARVPVAAHG